MRWLQGRRPRRWLHRFLRRVLLRAVFVAVPVPLPLSLSLLESGLVTMEMSCGWPAGVGSLRLTSSMLSTAAPLRRPADLASTTRPVTGVPVGITTVPALLTFAAMVPVNVSRPKAKPNRGRPPGVACL